MESYNRAMRSIDEQSKHFEEFARQVKVNTRPIAQFEIHRVLEPIYQILQ